MVYFVVFFYCLLLYVVCVSLLGFGFTFCYLLVLIFANLANCLFCLLVLLLRLVVIFVVLWVCYCLGLLVDC